MKEYVMEDSKTFIQTFIDRDDAYMWLDAIINRELLPGWSLVNAGLNYINHQWRAGASFITEQYSMEFDTDD